MFEKQLGTLEREEVLAERPFTSPHHTHFDANTLRYMVDEVCLALEASWGTNPSTAIVYHRPQPQNWSYRLLVTQPGRLLQLGQISVVGFFGQKRPQSDVNVANELDQQLVDEIPEHTDILSYSTLASVSGNFRNLVLFADPAAKDHWRNSKKHMQAVRELSPRYYTSVRLYNGQLPQGLRLSQQLTLTSVKYYDYESNPFWQGIRYLL